MDKGMVGCLIEKLMSNVINRNVEVNFSHLGKSRDYSIAIQTSLYEFDEGVIGPAGPVHVTLNNYLLEDTSELIKAIDKIIATWK
tara:strand:- start:5791 stop:6045 length:255 start_codon:yes stop_codon:yes gene_type:complete